MPAETEAILAVDIGATSLKVAVVGESGILSGPVRRRETPYPCWPSRLVEVVAEEAAAAGLSRVGVGFPGEFADGVVIEPGNLARAGGVTTAVDPEIESAWRGFDLQSALRTASGLDVRVVNDATLAALGCSEGRGTELVFTLGTGLGIALVVDGELARIRDVGAEVFRGGRTYDQLIGEHSRAGDEVHWASLLRDAVGGFIEEFSPDVVHFGGGNARRVDLGSLVGLGPRFVLNDNDDSLRGAARLFRGASGGTAAARR